MNPVKLVERLIARLIVPVGMLLLCLAVIYLVYILVAN